MDHHRPGLRALPRPALAAPAALTARAGPTGAAGAGRAEPLACVRPLRLGHHARTPCAEETPLIQYEIRWADLPGLVGRRLVLLLTRTPAYQYLAKIIVAEVTTTVRGIPQEVLLGRREGLTRPSVANLDTIHVVAKSRLGDRIRALGGGRQREVKRALGYALDWMGLKTL